MASPSLFVLDRIEGDRAIVEISGEQFEIPASALPPGSRDGAAFQLSKASIADVRAESDARLRRLQAQDTMPDEIEL